MTPQEITDQLRRIASSEDFASRSEELTQDWVSSGVGLEAVEPILLFMEENPGLDYGMPGALVHFVEGFYGKGYENRLIESVERRPIWHTIWMLNRVLRARNEINCSV
jgi:hypothetical protein